MIVQQTLTQLRALKLDGMASAFEEQLTLPTSGSLAFEDRFALLVERENAYRNTHRLKRLLTKARLKYGQACLEDLDTRTSRGLEAVKIASLAHGEWIERGQTVLIVGPTGVGKAWLACALAQRACRIGHSALYAACSPSPSSTASSSTISRCSRSSPTAARICSNSSTIAPTGAPL